MSSPLKSAWERVVSPEVLFFVVLSTAVAVKIGGQKPDSLRQLPRDADKTRSREKEDIKLSPSSDVSEIETHHGVSAKTSPPASRTGFSRMAALLRILGVLLLLNVTHFAWSMKFYGEL